MYDPPPHPPPSRPPLYPISSAPYSIDLELLAYRGWITLPISPSPTDPLYSTFARLFSASAKFFALPADTKTKYKSTQATQQASEEGYSDIPGEKSMITLRKAANTPTEFALRDRAAEAWRASGEVMCGVMQAIEASLCMKPGVLQRTMGPGIEMPRAGEENVATLLRMFRYERPVPARDAEPGSVAESRVVAEAHKDLGLLSIVVGHTPGLECWNPQDESWASCEEGATGALSATLLVGQTLAKFTNWRYAAGRHRVFVHPLMLSVNPEPRGDGGSDAPEPEPSALLADPAHRFSLVHALRAHLPERVSSADFTTPITGAYAPALQFADVSIAEIYKAISESHWNVNIGVAERRRQAMLLQDKAAAMQNGGAEADGRGETRTHKRMSIAGIKELFNRSGSRQAAASN